MSNQGTIPYYRVPTKAKPETLAAIRLAASRSTSLRVLLNHIAYLEDALSTQRRETGERRELVGQKP